MKAHLYYWQRLIRGSDAEIDYVVQEGENSIPIEVKSGKGTALISINSFLSLHKNSSYDRFSTRNYGIHQHTYSYPLYAIARAFEVLVDVIKS